MGEEEERDKKHALEWVARTEQGRRFLWDTLTFCGVYQDVAGEPNDVFKKLGKREVGLHLLGSLTDLDEELIFKMMREAKNRNIEQEIKNDSTSNTGSGNASSSSILDSLVNGSAGDSDSDSDYDYLPKHDSGPSPVF